MSPRLLWVALPHAVALLLGLLVLGHVRAHYELDAPWALGLMVLGGLHAIQRLVQSWKGWEVRASFNLHRYDAPPKWYTTSAFALPEIAPAFRTNINSATSGLLQPLTLMISKMVFKKKC